MVDTKSNRSVLIVAIICVSYLLLSTFYHQIDKYLTGVIFIILFLLLPLSFIAILFFIVKGVINIFRNRHNLTLKYCLPTVIAVTTLTYTLFSPWRLDWEEQESKVEMRACYEGTQNQSNIKFREDNTFEIHSTGVFFASYWYLGNWRKSNDTLFLEFSKEKNKLLDDTVIIHNEYLIPIRQVQIADSLKLYHRYYYLGYCKGLN